MNEHCKKCGGEIANYTVVKYVGDKGPYHEWCAEKVEQEAKS